MADTPNRPLTIADLLESKRSGKKIVVLTCYDAMFARILDPIVGAAMGWSEGSLLLALLTLVAAGTIGTAVYRTVWIAARL